MKPSRWLRLAGAFVGGLAAMLLLTACSGSVSVSVAEGKIEPAAESHYREAWKRGVEGMVTANEGFRSGVCNVGGEQRGCYDASVKAIDAIDQFLRDLQAIPVPSRYQAGDSAFRTALNSMRGGFERRNQGLATGSDADFVAGNDALKSAAPTLSAAYEKFPLDARPEPPL